MESQPPMAELDIQAEEAAEAARLRAARRDGAPAARHEAPAMPWGPPGPLLAAGPPPPHPPGPGEAS
eukprot:11197049-Lingulodinium_polyedra.AAC.1